MQQWHIGVSIFFVLSGFLIATRYIDRIKPTWQWARFYFQNRFARIYPIYFLVTVITLGVWFMDVPWATPRSLAFFTVIDKVALVLLNFSLLRAYFANMWMMGVLPAWTLTVEETFYFVAPWLLLCLKHNWQRIIYYPIIFFLLGCLLVGAATITPIHPFGFMKSMKFMLNLTFFGRSTEFMVGIGLALFMRQYPNIQCKGHLITCLSLAWIVLCMVIMTYAEMPYERLPGLESTLSFVINNLILPIGIAGFFWGLMNEKSRLRQVLETPFLELLGKSSYVFYLIHYGVLLQFLQTFITKQVLFIFPITVALSIFLFKVVEEPMHKKMHVKIA